MPWKMPFASSHQKLPQSHHEEP
uniref:Uncharacterized protein n=1 Tax=Rhizophora mucronata TaxID=61149 RepID=A0A2P2J4L7_RHIMU